MNGKNLDKFFVVRVDKALLEKLDSFANRTGESRSEFVRNAITDYIVRGRWMKKTNNKEKND